MVNKSKRISNRNTKLHLVFNEEKRREFLAGFHKRKLQRKKKAKEQLEKDLKEEKKRLKAEARESYKKLIKSYTPLPEVEDLLTEQYEDDDVNVKVVELSTTEIAKQNNWIGINQPHDNSDEELQPGNNSDSETEELPGMELNPRQPKKAKVEISKEVSKTNGNFKKILKKQATKNVQQSKAFQMKGRIEKQKQKKKAIQNKKLKMKIQNKSAKKKGRKKM